MASATTTVQGRYLKPDGTAEAGLYIKFKLLDVGADEDVTPEEVYSTEEVVARTDANGDYSKSLWNNGSSDTDSVYQVEFPDGVKKNVLIPFASAGGTIDMAVLLAQHQPGVSVIPDPASPTDLEIFATNPSANASFNRNNWITEFDIPAEIAKAEEWANKAEDSLVSAAAGGDEVDDYSALHWANKASASAGDAQTAQTAAEAAQAAAETAETNAAGSEASVAADAAAAATSASNAAASASSASATLTTVQSIANNLSYQGNHDASGNTAPSSPTVGQFWSISDGGTFGGITFVAGDLALYDGTGWNRVNVDTILQAEEAARKVADNARAFAGGVAFDGSQDFNPLLTPISVTGEFSFSGIVKFDEIGGDERCLWGDDNTASSGNNVYFRLAIGGNFQLAIGALPLILSPDSPLVVGQSYKIGLSRNSADLVTLYIDGVAQADTETISGTLEIAEFFTRNNGNLDPFIGTARDFSFFNRALSASEVAELHDLGLTAWLAKYPEDKWGDSTDLISGWDFTSGWSTTGSTTIDDFNSFTTSGSGGVTNLNLGMVVGKRYRVTINVTTTASGFSVSQFDSGLSIGATSNGSFEFIADSTGLYIRNDDAGTTDVLQLELVEVGAVAALPMKDGIGRQLKDLSGRYDALLSETGYQHLNPTDEGTLRVAGADASSAIYMLEASDIIPDDCIVTEILAEGQYDLVTANAQDFDDNRIRLNPNGANLEIQRSDGTNHNTLGTLTSPTSLADVDVTLTYKQVIR